MVYFKKRKEVLSVRTVLFLLVIGYIIRTFLLTILLGKLKINPAKALLPIYGDVTLLKQCTKKKVYGPFVFFLLLFLISACCTCVFEVQMKNIMSVGLEVYSRLHGDILPYHTMYTISRGVELVTFIIVTMFRFKICKDIQLSFGRSNSEFVLFFLLPPVGYIKMIAGNYKYYGNPYEEGFVNFADFA